MRLSIFIGCLLLSATLRAQITDTTKTGSKDSVKVTALTNPKPATSGARYKAGADNFTTELNVNLFQGNLSFNNALQQIKVRYFAADNLAYRFAMNFNSNSSNNGNSTVYGTSPSSYNDKRSTTTIGLGFGVEKHFNGTGRLSPYIGAEISLVNKSTTEKITNTVSGVATETDIDGAWQTGTYSNSNGNIIPYYSEQAYFRFGLNLVSGFDYYIAKNFYIGYEFAFQFYRINYKDINVTNTPSNNSNNPSYSSNQTFIGPNIVNGIRIGFVF